MQRMLTGYAEKMQLASDVRQAVEMLGHETGGKSIHLRHIEGNMCVVKIDGKRFGIWNIMKKAFAGVRDANQTRH